MTLSAMGDAETPAGGSVCIRYGIKARVSFLDYCRKSAESGEQENSKKGNERAYLKVTHEAATC